MKKYNFLKLAFAIAISELAGIVGSVFTVSAIPGWYAELEKPAINPPGWVFGPVWVTLYALMGISLFLIWKNDSSVSSKDRKRAFILFFIQLFLNAIWSIIFFGLKSPGWAFADIVLLWLAIVWTIVAFHRVFRPAAYLLAPYLLWVSFALWLNYSIWTLNI